MFSYLLQDDERNTESEHERPDLTPDLSSESEMELQLVCHYSPSQPFLVSLLKTAARETSLSPASFV